MLVCDELGDCYDDGTGTVDSGGLPTLGTNPVDSGNPCDTTSVSYDPIACANASGGFGGVPGADNTPGIGYFDPNANLADGEISWCQANPGACDANGVTASNLDRFCADNPTSCSSLPDGTVGTVRSNGAVRGPGGGVALPGQSPSGAPAGSGFLAGLSNFFNGLFQTCPAGYIAVQSANGQRQCVRAGTIPAGYSRVGAGGGFLGGVSLGTIAIIVLVLFLLARKRT